MDPFSLAVGIAGLASLATASIKYANEYLSAVKNGKDSIARLVTELEALQANLASLDTFLQSVSAKDLSFEPTSVLRSCTTACETSLIALCKKLDKVSDSKTSRFLWPLSEKEHQKTVQDLRNFTRWMHFSLSIDGCSLLSRTSNDVLKILEGQFENFGALQTLKDTTSQLNDAFKYQNQALQDDRGEKMRERILSWISATDHNQKHNSIRQPRVTGTGGWLLEQSEFLKWRNGSSLSNVLWCHGMQGSGKSVLTAAVAFFYFDYQDEDQQTPSAVLSSLLKQIIATMLNYPKSIFDAYEKYQKSGACLSLDEIEEIMLDILKSMDQMTIVIDALDECEKSRHRRTFLLLLQRIKQIPNVRLFVTSRQNFQDITEAFNAYPQIIISAHDSDLQSYMRQELQLAGVDDIVDDIFANEIIARVITKAQGMFLLAILHFRTVLKEPTAGAMEDALTSLSTSLDLAFKETILRIQRLPESRSRLGLSTLMWIFHAKSALQVGELGDALSIKLGQITVSPKYRPSPGIILECCQGLVAIDQKTARIHLAHYSIQEYLMVNGDKLFPDAEINIATTCLTYLLFDNLKEGPCVDSSALHHRILSYPFLSYASEFWGSHLQGLGTNERTKHIALAFLDCQNAIASANQISQFNKHYREMYWNAEECMSTTALHICSHFGLDSILLDLLDKRNLPINTATNMGTTPIIKAASRGYVSTVRMLLQKGADPYLKNWYGNALHCAAEGGYSGTIRELISYGMNPNACEKYCRSPLSCTLDNDSASAFDALIALGADIDVIDEHTEGGLSILHMVAFKNCLNIIDIVSKNQWGDLESKTGRGHTVLHYAAISRNLLMVRKLIEAGADIDAKDDRGLTPLELLGSNSLLLIE